MHMKCFCLFCLSARCKCFVYFTTMNKKLHFILVGCIGGCDATLRELTEICGTGSRNLPGMTGFILVVTFSLFLFLFANLRE